MDFGESTNTFFDEFENFFVTYHILYINEKKNSKPALIRTEFLESHVINKIICQLPLMKKMIGIYKCGYLSDAKN